MEEFWNNLFDVKLIENNGNIETYEANMKILIKKIKSKNEKEAVFFKQKLLNKKENMKIYNIIYDVINNYIICSYDPLEKEKMNLIINNNKNVEEKEATLEGHCDPLSKNEISNLFSKEEAMCKIEINKVIYNKPEAIKGSGFFLKINDDAIPFHKCLITNNHIIDENDIKMKKEIKIFIKNIEKSFVLSDERRIFTDIDLDYTCIEILEKDNIKKYFNIDPNIIENDIKIYENEDVFMLQYPDGKDLSFSNGKILSISENILSHNCSTHKGSSGSPIISRKSNISVISLHTGSIKENLLNNNFTSNLSTSIKSIINDIKYKFKNKEINKNDINEIKEVYKQNNYIIAELSVEENFKKRIINSFEKCKSIIRINNYKPSDYNNEKEIKENCEISINNKKIDFCYFYEFKEKGNYIIKYSFNQNLTKTDFMFYNCSSLSKIDLSNFNTQNVINMHSMFNGCSSLSKIDLSNFNTKNVTNMRNMFCGCSSLSKIDLSNLDTHNMTDMAGMFYNCSSLLNINLYNFNTQNVTNMYCIFYGCSSLSKIDLSNLDTQNVTNMYGMFYNCRSLSKIDLSNFNTQNVTDMSGMFYNCSSLSKINLSNFNTQNATDLNYMFYSCNNLKKNNLITKDMQILNQYDNYCIIF